MDKFKIGDRVICVNDEGWPAGCVVKGRIYVVVDNHYEACLQGEISIDQVNSPYSNDFKLYKEGKEQVKFDMKTQPWFIRVENKEQYNLTNKWLKENFGGMLFSGYTEAMVSITNTCPEGHHVYASPMWSDITSFGNYKDSRAEIKLNFKTVVDSVEWPSIKSEKDLKIEELENTIAEAQKQLRELKEM